MRLVNRQWSMVMELVYLMLLLNAHTLSRQVEAGAEEDPSGLEETVKEV